jgi:Leucine-rich repeat (LRR) protein
MVKNETIKEGDRMRKFFHCLVLCCLVCLVLTAGASQEAQPISTFALQFDPNATLVDLGDTKVEDFEALTALLDQLPKVETVNLYASHVPREQMANLTARYPQVFFGFTLRVAEHIIRTDQTAFSTLHNNKSPMHSSQDFDVLRYCTRLQALDLGHNSLTDLSFLENLTEIKVLILAANQISDISPLKNLTQLEYAELFKNKITDITPLENMSRMLDLNLCFNNIKDYTTLEKLDSLERLWLYNSNNYSNNDPVKPDVIARLKAALPNCHIDTASYSTLGGWREHPRYFTIFEIFKTSVYQPFGGI